MKTRNNIQLIVLTWSMIIGTTTVFGQSKMIQKEMNKRDHVSFTQI